MRCWSATVRVLLALICLSTGCSGPSQVPVKPSFELVSLDGTTLGPGDFSGTVLMIDFWASWCGPCRIQHEVLTVLQEEYADRGVSFLAINSGEPKGVAAKFAAEHPFTYPVLLDENSTVSDRLGVLGLPTLMLLDREGEIVYFEPGLLSSKQLRKLLEKAIVSAEPGAEIETG